MRNVAAFLLGLVWFAIFGVYAIVTLPITVALMALGVGAAIRGDWDDEEKWFDRIYIVYAPIAWLGEVGIGWIRNDNPDEGTKPE